MNSSATKVLVVEDNSIDVEAVERALSNSTSEFEIAIAATVVEASQRLLEGSIDVVVLDLGLPDSAGVESVQKIRASDREVPIVVLTAWDDVFTSKILKAGAQSYISKANIGDGRLVDAIEAAIAEDQNNSTSRKSPKPGSLNDSELLELVTQLRLACSDFVLNHPELRDSSEIQRISRISKSIYDKLSQ